MLPDVSKKLDGFTLIAHKRFSLLEADSYLSIVLLKRDGGDFVVWTYNSESGGFSGGFYSRTLEAARTNFYHRGRI